MQSYSLAALLALAVGVVGAGAQEYGGFSQGREVSPPAAALERRERVEPINRMLEGGSTSCCRG